MENFLTAFFTSAIVSVITGKLLELHALKKGKQIDFVNSYHKLILEKRLEAYEQFEAFILNLKLSVVDDDGKPYHLVFANEHDWQRTLDMVTELMPYSLWLSVEAFDKTREFNVLTKDITETTDRKEFGKNNYLKFVSLRESLESIRAHDLIQLHDIENFLKQRVKPIFT